MALNVHVIKCAGVPTAAPTEVGQHWINTSNGDIYESNGTSVVGDWILQHNESRMLEAATGRYYDSSGPMFHGGYGTDNYSTGKLRSIPIFIAKDKIFDRIGIEVTTAVSGKLVRLGIYDNVGGLPVNLILDAGTISCSTTGFKEITISETLTEGWYWLAHETDSTSVFFKSFNSSSTSGSNDFGFSDGTSVTREHYLLSTHTFGSLPATFPSFSYNSGEGPRILLRST